MSSPQGDGNKRPLPLLRHCPIAIYPREGTKTSTTMAVCTSTMIAIYPREGTKTHCKRETKLDIPLQFIPARGRKHVEFLRVHNGCVIAIYPREGTKTCLNTWLRCRCPPHCNLSPRGDENCAKRRILLHGERLQFIPVRGRKLHRLAMLCAVQPKLQFIPVRGRKRSFLPVV